MCLLRLFSRGLFFGRSPPPRWGRGTVHCDDTGWHYLPRYVGKPTYVGMTTRTRPLNPLQPHRRGGHPLLIAKPPTQRYHDAPYPLKEPHCPLPTVACTTAPWLRRQSARESRHKHPLSENPPQYSPWTFLSSSTSRNAHLDLSHPQRINRPSTSTTSTDLDDFRSAAHRPLLLTSPFESRLFASDPVTNFVPRRTIQTPLPRY